MPTETFTLHGGRLAAAKRAWPQAPEPWIDLSTGINPAPYPALAASRAARARLPFPEEVADVEAAASVAFGLTDPERVVATAGAEAALRLLPKLLQAETVWIPGPTYASHAEAWVLAEAKVTDQAERAKAAVVVNPNNPDGRVHDRAFLLALADRLAARGGWLVVDESFAEVTDAPSIATAGHSRIVALRSFGKFYGLAGLRLGFVLGPPDVARQVRLHLGDWPIGADAVAAGSAAYPDAAWRARTRGRLAAHARRLDRLLLRAGFEIIGGTSLFRLARAEDAGRRFERLCAAGILTRPFRDAPTQLRFGLPRARDVRRVAAALGARA